MIANDHTIKLVTIEQAEKDIRDGWLAQFRGEGFISRVIQAATGGVHSHSAMLSHPPGGKVEVLEIRELIGPRIITLREYALSESRRIDIYALDQMHHWEMNGTAAANYMRAALLRQRKYSYWSIFRLYLRKIPGLRMILQNSTDDELTTGNVSAYCSHLVAESYRLGGGVDPVPRLPDHFVDPNHLTHSLLFWYYGTLTL